jgi:GTPase SAR1 family protein
MAYDFAAKVVIVGESGTGKSSLLVAFTDPGHFQPLHHTTIGVEFGSKNVIARSGHVVKLQLWDTAGQEAFRAIVRSYYRGTAAAVVVFDVTRRASFVALDSWLRELREHKDDGEGAPQARLGHAASGRPRRVLIVGNKSDRASEREVSVDEGRAFAAARGVDYFETSARTGDNVAAAFKALAEAILADTLDGSIDPLAVPTQGVTLGHTAEARAHAEVLRVRRVGAGVANTPHGGCCTIS